VDYNFEGGQTIMDRNPAVLYKTLVVGLIVLFIGIGMQPAIADVSFESDDSELVEITTEVCGLNGGKQTVKLTQQEAYEVEEIFNSIRERLNNTESREETEEIFKEAVVELDRYDLLGGLSVKQAQKLVIGEYQNTGVGKFLEKIGNRYGYKSDNNSNALCLIAGETSNTFVFGPSMIFRALVCTPLYLFSWLIVIIWDRLETLGLVRLSNFLHYYILVPIDEYFFISGFPFAELGGFIILGFQDELPPGHWNNFPAKGWLWSQGLFGIREWEGVFYGNLNGYIGVSGFTGLKIGGTIFNLLGPKSYYLGSAFRVKIREVTPL